MARVCAIALLLASAHLAAVSSLRSEEPMKFAFVPTNWMCCVESSSYGRAVRALETLKASKDGEIYKKIEVSPGTCAKKGYMTGPIIDPCLPGANVFLDNVGDHRWMMHQTRKVNEFQKTPMMRDIAGQEHESLLGENCGASG